MRGLQGLAGAPGAVHLAVAFLVEVIEDALKAGLLLSTRVLLTRRHLLGHRESGLCRHAPAPAVSENVVVPARRFRNDQRRACKSDPNPAPGGLDAV